MNAIVKLFVVLLASTCAASATADEQYSRKEIGAAVPSELHSHGGLAEAGQGALLAVQEFVRRTLLGVTSEDTLKLEKAKLKAEKAKLKKAKKKLKKQKATRKCKKSAACKNLIGKERKACVKACVDEAMTKKKTKKGTSSSTLSVPGVYGTPAAPGYYYGTPGTGLYK